MRYVLALIVLLCGTAQAVTYYPSTPIFIAGPQGRPIPAATVNILNLDGTSAGSLFTDANGSVPFSGYLPPSQILQFFTNPGTYQVTVAGSGVTKTFNITVGTGFGTSLGTISIDRTAETLLTNTSNPAALVCSGGAPGCELMFDDGDIQEVQFDFITPSFQLLLSSFLLSWESEDSNTSGAVEWVLNWCTQRRNEPPCVAGEGPNQQTFMSAVSGIPGGRSDLVLTADSWHIDWPTTTHIYVSIKRMGLDIPDSMGGRAALRNVRLELMRSFQ